MLDDGDTLDTMGEKFMTIDYPPEPNTVVNTSILSYSFDNKSFRRGEGIFRGHILRWWPVRAPNAV